MPPEGVAEGVATPRTAEAPEGFSGASDLVFCLERTTGLEPATLTLARG